MARPPAPSGTVKPMPSTSGHSLPQKSMPSTRSRASEEPNMHWLEVTRPWWICSGVRLETMRTS
ncbi:Uncharacterised protein [Mycobacteroides abscessus subsp. abscessus]|nr:Uncharacterised protein [Mycobacteroides abscessus subsp. abscessus]